MGKIKSFFIALSLTLAASSCSLFDENNQNEVGTGKPDFDMGDLNSGVSEDTGFDVSINNGGKTSGGTSSGGGSSTGGGNAQPTIFNVLFRLDEETILDSDDVEMGKYPKYKGVFPTKEPEIDTYYNFVGWHEDKNAHPTIAIKTEDLPTVYQDTVYFAIFEDTQEQMQYQITFMNDDIILGDPVIVNHGERPEYRGEEPARIDATGSGTIYTFVGWHIDPYASTSDAYTNDSLPFATKDNTYYAIFSSYNPTKYQITFMNGNDIIDDPISVEEGTRPTCPPDQSKDDLVYEDEGEKIVYQFIGWHTDPNVYPGYAYDSSSIPFATQDETYYAIYSETTCYLVSFYDGSSLLQSDYVEVGLNPSYSKDEPTKIDTTNSGLAYSFVGWSEDQWADPSEAIKGEDLPEVSAKTDYYAIFSSTTITYQITFMNGDTPLGDPVTVLQGTRPQYEGSQPTKVDTTGKGIVYTFIGWHTNPSAAPYEAFSNGYLPLATKDETYYAVFSSSVVKYNVIFKKDNITVLYVDEEVPYGSQPKYEGDLPKKDRTEANGITTIYRFVGWSEDPYANATDAIKAENLPGVTKDNTTYYAIFEIESSDKASYLVTFLMNDGRELASDYVFYNDIPEYNGDKPSIDDYWFGAEKTTYEFVGWSENPGESPSNAIATKNLPKVTKKTTYYAIFSRTTVTITYTITYMNGNEVVGNPSTVKHGVKPIFVGEPPTKENEEIDGVTCLYTFAGWNEDPDASPSDALASDQLPVASKDTVYFAIYSVSTISIGLDKTSVELDCGRSREIASSDSDIKGTLESVFPQSAIISCDYTLSGHLTESDIKVNWRLDRNTYNYFFSMTPIEEEESGKSSVQVTAKVQGHISYLDADIVLASDESVILKTLTCRVKSVMTFVYKVSDYSRTLLAGEDVSAYGSGYEVSFYNDNYKFTLHGDNNNMGGVVRYADLVIPSKLKVDGTVKPVVCLDQFAKVDGSSYLNSSLQMESLVVPNSIIHIKKNVFKNSVCRCPQSKAKGSNYFNFTLDFETKENSMVMIEEGNFFGNTNISSLDSLSSDKGLARVVVVDKYYNGVGFPYNSYVVTNADSISYDSVTSFDNLTPEMLSINKNNSVLWKKVSSS